MWPILGSNTWHLMLSLNSSFYTSMLHIGRSLHTENYHISHSTFYIKSCIQIHLHLNCKLQLLNVTFFASSEIVVLLNVDLFVYNLKMKFSSPNGFTCQDDICCHVSYVRPFCVLMGMLCHINFFPSDFSEQSIVCARSVSDLYDVVFTSSGSISNCLFFLKSLFQGKKKAYTPFTPRPGPGSAAV